MVVIAFLKKNWAYLTIVVLAGILLYQYTHPASPSAGKVLGKKQQNQAKVALGKSAKVIAGDTAAANRANAAAAVLNQKGAAAAARAQVYRLKTHRPHAAPVPVADTTAERVKRFLTNY